MCSDAYRPFLRLLSILDLDITNAPIIFFIRKDVDVKIGVQGNPLNWDTS